MSLIFVGIGYCHGLASQSEVVTQLARNIVVAISQSCLNDVDQTKAYSVYSESPVKLSFYVHDSPTLLPL